MQTLPLPRTSETKVTKIDAYFDSRSYKPGDEAKLHVSSREAYYDVSIVRQGAEDHEVWSVRHARGSERDVPDDVVENGCGWPVDLTIPISTEWETGFYLVRLYPAGVRDVQPALAGFVLRPGKQRSKILFCLTTSTWDAYNEYGGANTYSSGTESYEAGAQRVSRLRPLAPGLLWKPSGALRLANTDLAREDVPFTAWAVENGISAWSGASGWWNWEYPFVRWAEQNGFDLDYACSDDLHADSDLLDGYDLFLSVGHDEYWSWEMRDSVEGFIEEGGNVAFLSGNTSFWQVRWSDDGTQMTAFKSAVQEDPILKTKSRERASGLWSNPVTGRPENYMTGLSFCRGGYARMAGCSPRGPGGYTIYRPEHWVFEGTGVRHGDLIGATDVIVGYESDGCLFRMEKGRPVPTGEDTTPLNFEILGIAPAALMNRENAIPGLYTEEAMTDLELVATQVAGGCTNEALEDYSYGHAIMGVFERGGTVFNSGCTEWVCGLRGRDPVIEQITKNVLNRLSVRTN